MRASDFHDQSLGELVPTSFVEHDVGGFSRTIKGLAFVPRPLPPVLDRVGLVGRLYDVLDRAKTNLLRLEAKVESLPSRAALLAAIRSREAQSSSKIENTVASLKDIALAGLSEDTGKSEAAEVLQNRRAIELGLRSKLPISIRLLCDMHRELIREPRTRPGQFRETQAYIGSESRGFEQARFVPPPPDRIDGCMREWELFVNPGALSAPRRAPLPDLIELAMAHYQFEAIHPFSDGNGRLGRAVVNLSPIKSGFLRQPVCNLSEWVHEHREEYYNGLLRVSTHGDWEGWTRFFCTALAEQSEQDLTRADRVAGLYDKYQQLITQRRNSIMLVKLIDRLFGHHAITIPMAARVMGISYSPAQKHVEFLVKHGVLRHLGSGGHGKIYIASAILRAIRGRGED
jgi:Fic family protein